MLRAALTTSFVLAAGPAFAAEVCRVEVVGPASPAWHEAAAQVALSPDDCASVRVEAGETTGELVFTTTDGRWTRRSLGAPEELAPTVKALKVSYGLPVVVAQVEPTTPPDEEDEPPSAAPAEPVEIEARKLVEPRPVMRFVYGLNLGQRGGADGLHTPVLEGTAGLHTGLLDLGLILRIEGHYTTADEANEEPKTTGGGLGINVGTRLPVGPTALTFGGHILLAAYHQEGNGNEVDTEGRLGAYLGIVAPRRTRTRLRVGVSGEMVMAHMGESDKDERGTPIMPWLAFLLSIGVEYGAP